MKDLLHSTFRGILCLSLSASAWAQAVPGEIMVRSNPNGNDIAIHRPDGSLVASSQGPDTDWRIGMAPLPGGGWVTFRLTLAGWVMMHFDFNGALQFETPAPLVNSISNTGVGITTEGVILVGSNPWNQPTVLRFRSDGTALSSIDYSPIGGHPDDFCATKDGGFWAFTLGGFDSSTQNFVPGHGTRYDRDGQVIDSVSFPSDYFQIDALPDGTFWATRSNDRQVYHYDSNGILVDSFFFDLGQTALGQWKTPFGLSTAKDGSLWFTVKYTQTIIHFDPSTQTTLGSFTTPGFGLLELRIIREPSALGDNYCLATTNSTGLPGAIQALGSAVVADNHFSLRVQDLPLSTIGIFIASPMTGWVTNPGGSAGHLCLGGAFGRFRAPGQIIFTGSSGEFTLPIDLNLIPTPFGTTNIAIGESWNFQSWFRDPGTGGSNFTDAAHVVFL